MEIFYNFTFLQDFAGKEAKHTQKHSESKEVNEK
jgi:hypothetical protein